MLKSEQLACIVDVLSICFNFENLQWIFVFGNLKDVIERTSLNIVAYASFYSKLQL